MAELVTSNVNTQTALPPPDAQPTASTSAAPKISRARLAPRVQSGAEVHRATRKVTGERGHEHLEEPDALSERLTVFLTEHVTQLNQMREEGVLEQVCGPNHADDMELLELLTVKEIVDGREIGRQVSPDMIKKYLESPEGKLATLAKVEEQLIMKTAALGMFIREMPQGVRENIVNSVTTATGEGQGPANAAIRDLWNMLTQWNRDNPGALRNGIWGTLGTTAAGAAAGLAIGNVPGAIIGAGIGLVGGPPSLYGLMQAFKRGDRQFYQQCTATLMMARRPEEAEYAKRMWGVDAQDYIPAPTRGNPNRLILNPARIPESTANVREIIRELHGLVDTRREFHRAIGGEEMLRDLDATPAQFLHRWGERGAPRQQERVNTLLAQLRQRYFEPNNGGIRDVWGQTPDNPYFSRTLQPDRQVGENSGRATDAFIFSTTAGGIPAGDIAARVTPELRRFGASARQAGIEAAWIEAGARAVGAAAEATARAAGRTQPEIDQAEVDAIRGAIREYTQRTATAQNYLRANPANRFRIVDAIDYQGNQERLVAAQRQAVMFLTERFIERRMPELVRIRAVDLSIETSSPRAVLANRLEQVRSGGDDTRRQAEVASRRRPLEEQRTRLQAADGDVASYREAQTARSDSRKAFETEFPNAAGAGRDLPTELARVQRILTDDTAGAAADTFFKREEQIETDFTTESNRFTRAYEATVNPPPPAPRPPKETIALADRTLKGQIERLERARDRKLTDLRTEQQQVEQARTRLLALQSETQQADRRITEAERRIITSSTVDTRELRRDYTNVRRLGVTAQQLRSLPFTRLQGMVAGGGITDEQLYNAIAEANARTTETGDPARTPARVANYDALTARPVAMYAGARILREEALRTLDRAVLIREINALWAADTASGIAPAMRRGWEGTAANNADPANLARLADAIAEAQNRLVVRHIARRQSEITALDQQIRDIEINGGGAPLAPETRDQIEAAVAALDRQDIIFTKAWALDSQENRARYFDDTPVAAADTDYSQAERDVANGPHPKGYYEIMRLIFNYQGKASEDPGFFTKTVRLLPPERMAEWLNEEMNLGFGANPDITDILRALAQDTTPQSQAGGVYPRINGRIIRSGFERIIKRLEQTGLALAQQ